MSCCDFSEVVYMQFAGLQERGQFLVIEPSEKDGGKKPKMLVRGVVARHWRKPEEIRILSSL